MLDKELFQRALAALIGAGVVDAVDRSKSIVERARERTLGEEALKTWREVVVQALEVGQSVDDACATADAAAAAYAELFDQPAWMGQFASVDDL